MADKVMESASLAGPQSAARLQDLARAVSRVLLGKEDVVRLSLTALLARGHILIEDIPGVGKTTLAHGLARSIACSFRRIQFTSDLLPSDILGIKIYEPTSGEFRFMAGPIFNSIVLADEINRTTPRTQSALLEAMNESQVTIEGETFELPRPFMVIATQNPLEHHGTYPLPDSQLDRFMMSVQVGYPGLADERRIVTGAGEDPMSESFKPVMRAEELIYWQSQVDQVRTEPEVVEYVLEIVHRTREHKRLRLGVSPRGAIALRQAAKSLAMIEGRDYCLPDDVKTLAAPVLAHRLILSGPSTLDERRLAAVEVMEEILDAAPVPY